ncbi:hypothetical protein PR202_gb13746 [Eleusine coracana subsp. coracana]|uniref:Uncharacterized protein n=1 Tax=Eleusine coracana subsp. coracana TaxID=191504 RepID=A0AAV5EUI5_ELECO|nr:hypothetical protein PR202_gb13746 [Eleusine coracana subsp. coracana]
MVFVTGALGSVIPKLALLLKEEYKLQTGLRKKIESLSRDLESMHAALRKVADVPPEQLDNEVKLWARDVRELSYDMEDILDTFLVRVHGCEARRDPDRFRRAAKKIGKLFSKSKARHQIAGMIKTINQQAEVVAERHRRYRAEDIMSKPAAPRTVDPRLGAMYKEMTQLVGIEKPSDELISMLSPLGSDEMKIVSVVGPGGLGKTTLAKAVYFIVIDDIWKTDIWETRKFALVENNNGSRLITTTRISDVAVQADEVYKLKPLPDDQSEKLFYTRIFGANGTSPNNQLKEVSNKIIKKCDGVPLAIITMASLLVGKTTEEWIEVCHSIVFRDKKKNQQVSDTEWILSLSYYDLPPHLKTCLLYISAFPEDYFIRKDSLIWKWVAEGFIHKEPGTRLFEIGEGYFNELINRSMIQVVESGENGIVYGCRIHDMVLDLRVKSQEENFVTIVSVEGNEGISSTPSRVRRLAHQNIMVAQTQQDAQASLGHVRTFIAIACLSDMLSFMSFQLLRVLALVDCRGGDRIRLDNIQNLLHLRYLGLRRINCSELPEGIGALKFLQTLDLEWVPIKELPSSLGMLTQLICLRVRSPGVIVPNGVIEKLTSLEDLFIQVEEDKIGQFVKDLGKLRELRVLDIEFIILDEVSDESMESD